MKVFYDSNVVLDVLLNRTDFLSNSGWKDFEDSVQYSVAKKANCKCIVTRNKKDYKFSDIPVYTPTEFIELY